MGMNKSRFVSGNDLGSLRLDVGLEYHKIIDYDRKKMRRALNTGANLLRKEARRLLSRKAIASKPGEAPAMQSGKLMRAIGTITRGSKGGWVKVGPRSIKGSIFYPAFLFYGSPKTGLAKRANYMEIALKNKNEILRSNARSALQDALVPR